MLAALRPLLARDRYVVYEMPAAVRARRSSPLTYVGVNTLRHDEDPPQPELPPTYETFVSEGDAGVLALRDHRLVGWAWARRTPFEEPLGCGAVRYGPGMEVIRYLEVRPDQRGRGYSADILSELTLRLAVVRCDRVIALVGSSNRPSRACFERVGYRPTRHVNVYHVLNYRPPIWIDGVTCEN